mgnify:CR=1 FL=1
MMAAIGFSSSALISLLEQREQATPEPSRRRIEPIRANSGVVVASGERRMHLAAEADDNYRGKNAARTRAERCETGGRTRATGERR